MISRLLTPAETAIHLGVTVQTLAAWRWKKLGPPFRKVGRWVRYDLAEVDAWTRRSRETPGATS